MNKKTSKIIGAKIRLLRKNHQMSIQELSNLLGISQQHQSRHELGEIRIHVDTLFRIAEIFEVSVEELMSDFIPPPEEQKPKCQFINKQLIEAELLLSPEQHYFLYK